MCAVDALVRRMSLIVSIHSTVVLRFSLGDPSRISIFSLWCEADLHSLLKSLVYFFWCFLVLFFFDFFLVLDDEFEDDDEDEDSVESSDEVVSPVSSDFFLFELVLSCSVYLEVLLSVKVDM